MVSRSFCLNTKNINDYDKDEDDDDLLSKKDVERLTNLWKSMKDSKKHLNNSKTNINASFLNTNAPHQMNNSFNNQTMKQYDDSFCEQYASNNNDISLNISKIPHIPKQTDTIILQKAKDSNKQLLKKVKENEAELEQCHQKIAKLVSQNQTQSKQIVEMSQKLEQYAQSQKEILEKSRLNTNMIEQSLEDKDRLLDELKMQLTESKEQVQRMINSNKEIMNENSRLVEQLEAKSVENERIKDRLSQVEKCLDEIYNDKQANGIAQVEIDYLKSDIERLLKLLKSTSEVRINFAYYKELSFMADESMSIRYLKNNASFIKNYRLNNQNTSSVDLKASTMKRNCCGCAVQLKQNNDVNEKQLWIPRDAFQFAFELSQKHNKKFSEEIIEELLFGLNQIWSNKEKTAVDRIKKQYETENKELKKQLNKNLTYDEVQARKKIQRLKSELSKTRKGDDFSVLNTTNPLPPSRGSSLNGTSHSCKQQEKIIYFQDAIKLFQEYESEIRMCKEELQETKNKMKQMDDDISLYDKVIYMEGALWMIEKIITDVTKSKQQSFNQLNQHQLDLDRLLLITNNNNEEEEVDINAILKLTKNLLASQSNINQQLLDKYLNLKDSTQKQIEKSSKTQHKLKKQRKSDHNQQSKYNQENINSINSFNKNMNSQYEDYYDKEQQITSAAISPISNHQHKYYSNYNTESNTTTQRVSQNLIPQVYNTNSVYSSNHHPNTHNYLHEQHQNSQKAQQNIDMSSHRQNNHYSSNSTPIQQYYSTHSAQYNSRSKEILDDSMSKN